MYQGFLRLFFLKSELMLQVCHVQEAVRPLWGSWWPVLVLHGPNSPCPRPQCAWTSNNRRCWDRTETVLWSEPGVVPDHGATNWCFWLFWGVPEGETLGGFVPRSSTRGVCGQKTRVGAGGYLVPALVTTWKRCSGQNRDACPILLSFPFIFWGQRSSQSFPEETERGGIMPRHECRMSFFGVVISGTKFHGFILHMFSFELSALWRQHWIVQMSNWIWTYTFWSLFLRLLIFHWEVGGTAWHYFG